MDWHGFDDFYWKYFHWTVSIIHLTTVMLKQYQLNTLIFQLQLVGDAAILVNYMLL